MDSVVRGLVLGHLVGESIRRNREARQRWCAVGYSPTSGMAWAWNHRTARGAEKAVLALCEGPQARLWACGAEITIAVARGPRGAYACQWADPSMPQAACDGALAKCRATYPPGDFGGARVWLALVIDARRGLMYQH
jgi:Domain of unknown function (DUF4189)